MDNHIRPDHTGHIFQKVDISGQAHLGDKHIHNYGIDDENKCHQTFFISPYERIKNINPLRDEGTCGWVLNHPQYRRWRDSEGDDLLWISADPGCGKSVLSRSLVDKDLQLSKDETVCYFFFKDNREQDSLASALCAILHQLFSSQRELIYHALPHWKKTGEGIRSDVDRLSDILFSTVTDPSARPVFCIMDALDECHDQDRRQLITTICERYKAQLKSKKSSRLKFLLTSRPYDNVQRWFEGAGKSLLQIRLRGEDENDKIHTEIDLVIEREVKKLAVEFEFSDDHEKRLLQKLLEMEHRTYLWLHLAIEEIREAYINCIDQDDVLVPSLPTSVDEAYERILNKIKGDQRPNARLVLTIVLGARRALSVGEMGWALRAAKASNSKDRSIAAPNVNLLAKQIRLWCGLFVFLNDGKLYLIHQTAREFLLGHAELLHANDGPWKLSFLQSSVELEMGRICVNFLCLRLMKEWEQINGHAKDHFNQYCISQWTEHLQPQEIEKDEDLLNKVLLLYRDFYIFEYDKKAVKYKSVQNLERSGLTALHVAASFNHYFVIDRLSAGQDLDLKSEDDSGRTALFVAAMSGHKASVESLLNAGADINRGGRYDFYFGLTELRLNLNLNLNEIRQELTKRRSHTDLKSAVEYYSPLQAASMTGHLDVVDVLLAHGADANSTCSGLKPPLLLALEIDHGDIVATLLKHGADVNLRVNKLTPLFRACRRSQHDILKTLLENGANANPDDLNNRPLPYACWRGDERMVELLLAHGADVNLEGMLGTPLYYALLFYRERIASMLLEHGADPIPVRRNSPNLRQRRPDLGNLRGWQTKSDTGGGMSRRWSWTGRRMRSSR